MADTEIPAQPQAPVASRRLVQLDGIRGIGLLSVIMSHFIIRTPHSRETMILMSPVNIGMIGVECFFVLSGFLITTLLLRERDRHGHIDVRKFLARRLLRILPPFAVFLVIVGVLGAFGVLNVPGLDLLLSATFTYNLHPGRTLTLAHTWSLAAEMQWYLVWPLMIAKLSRRRLFQAAVLIVVLSPVVRVAVYFLLPQDYRAVVAVLPITRMDSFVMGGAIALLPSVVPGLHRRVEALALRRFAIPVILVALVVCAALGIIVGGPWDLPFGWSLESLLLVPIFLLMTSRTANAVQRVTSHPWAIQIGAISYSVYLWQEIFIFCAKPGTLLHNPLIGLVGMFAAAILSRRLIEQPALRLRARFTA